MNDEERPFVVTGLRGIENTVSHLSAVEVKFVEAQPANQDAGRLHGFADEEGLAQERSGIRGASFRLELFRRWLPR